MDYNIIALIIGIITITNEYYLSSKDKAIKDIQSILSHLRGCLSWDERSEDKLHGWMNDTYEKDLHRSSLIELKKIRTNLFKYQDIHVNMVMDEM